MFSVLGWMLFGLIVGLIAKLVMPGKDPGGVFVTMLIGIVGALLGGFLGRAIGWYQPGEAAGFFVATLGAIGFVMPLIINGVLLAATVRIFERKKQWFRVEGFFAGMWMAVFLTLAHGALWLAVDYIPKHV